MSYLDRVGGGTAGGGSLDFTGPNTVEMPTPQQFKGNNNMRGVATLLNGQTTIAVAFGTAWEAAPVAVIVTPKSDPGALRYWIASITSAGFTITVNTAIGADTVFMWLALR
jgi:hypothetical protein